MTLQGIQKIGDICHISRERERERERESHLRTGLKTSQRQLTLIVILFDSVAPLVNIISFGSAPIKSATFYKKMNLKYQWKMSRQRSQARTSGWSLGREKLSFWNYRNWINFNSKMKKKKETKHAYLPCIFNCSLSFPSILMRPWMGIPIAGHAEWKHCIKNSWVLKIHLNQLISEQQQLVINTRINYPFSIIQSICLWNIGQKEGFKMKKCLCHGFWAGTPHM